MATEIGKNASSKEVAEWIMRHTVWPAEGYKNPHYMNVWDQVDVYLREKGTVHIEIDDGQADLSWDACPHGDYQESRLCPYPATTYEGIVEWIREVIRDQKARTA